MTMLVDKKELLADLKGIHLTVTDLINGLGDTPEGRLKFSREDMNNQFHDYLGDIAIYIQRGEYREALKMVQQGRKIQWHTDE